jgi:DMSO/TMAO reductase YedYZ molybdopterin-dependent catalytic subunit
MTTTVPREVDLDMVVAPSRPPRRAAAVAGVIAGAVAVATGMLAAAIIEAASPIDAVGSEVIDRVPRWLKELAIEWFGERDKLALRIGIITILVVVSLAVGILAARRFVLGVTGIAAFGVVGAMAAAHRPGQPTGAWLPSLLGAVAGIVALRLLLRPTGGPTEVPHESRVPLGWDRRRFLVAAGATSAAAGVIGATGIALERRRIGAIENDIPVALPPVAGGDPSATPAAPPGAEVNPATPFITPNDDFYRIDTALSFPRIDVDAWRLTIDGMVDTPLTLSYADIQAMAQSEHMVTLCCVSNDVGGKYIGNAVWQGVRLADLLRQAGVRDGVEQVFSRSIDGWTCGFPIDVALDGREAMLAIGMNGAPLPLAHGFPARLVVPGLYGYVSATKWLESITLTTWDDATGYWIPRGWSRLGPIKTQSRIDYPRRGVTVPVGPAKLAGVAWAQHRGIARVEVRIDQGPWQEATLGEVSTDDSWRQWVIDWDATAGKHVVQVRATDKTGETQTEEVTDVAPDGATGYHTRTITVG